MAEIDEIVATLKVLAPKGTQGKWEYSGKDGNDNLLTNSGNIMCNETYYPWVPYTDDFMYICAASPDSILKLIAALEESQRTIATLQAQESAAEAWERAFEWMDDPSTEDQFDRPVYAAPAVVEEIK